MNPKRHSKPPILARFGKKVRAERRKQGISQEALAEAAGVSRVYIGEVERAQKTISLEYIEKIATALRTDVWRLLQC